MASSELQAILQRRRKLAESASPAEGDAEQKRESPAHEIRRSYDFGARRASYSPSAAAKMRAKLAAEAADGGLELADDESVGSGAGEGRREDDDSQSHQDSPAELPVTPAADDDGMDGDKPESTIAAPEATRSVRSATAEMASPPAARATTKAAGPASTAAPPAATAAALPASSPSKASLNDPTAAAPPDPDIATAAASPVAPSAAAEAAPTRGPAPARAPSSFAIPRWDDAQLGPPPRMSDVLPSAASRRAVLDRLPPTVPPALMRRLWREREAQREMLLCRSNALRQRLVAENVAMRMILQNRATRAITTHCSDALRVATERTAQLERAVSELAVALQSLLADLSPAACHEVKASYRIRAVREPEWLEALARKAAADGGAETGAPGRTDGGSPAGHASPSSESLASPREARFPWGMQLDGQPSSPPGMVLSWSPRHWPADKSAELKDAWTSKRADLLRRWGASCQEAVRAGREGGGGGGGGRGVSSRTRLQIDALHNQRRRWARERSALNLRIEELRAEVAALRQRGTTGEH